MVAIHELEARLNEIERRLSQSGRGMESNGQRVGGHGLNVRGRPTSCYTYVGIRESLPTASKDFADQLTIVRGGAGVADKLYVCRKTAAGGYEWVELTASGVEVQESGVSRGVFTILDFLGADFDVADAGGGVVGIELRQSDVKAAVDYRTSTSGNVTSTTGTDLASLQVSLTLDNGITYDLVCFGVIDANAPSGDFIFAAANVDGVVQGWSDTGTVGGERALPFAGVKLGVVGTGAAVTLACHMKVGSGTGTVNTGSIVGAAIPRNG